MSEEQTYVPGTELTEDQFVEEYMTRVKVDVDGVDPTEADEWAKENANLGEMTLNMKASISQAVVEKASELYAEVQANQESTPEVAVEASVSDSEETSEVTSPDVQGEDKDAENGSESA